MGFSLGRARRGHMSSKVPGARNRPAPARPESEAPSDEERRAVVHGADSLSGHDQEDEQQDQEESSTEQSHAEQQPPLVGLVVSFTGIPISERQELAANVSKMGAETQLDLTHAATHLVSLKVGSEKYRRATENGMAVIAPDWIRAVLVRWVEHHPFDPAELTEQYLLRPLEGLRIGIASKGALQTVSLARVWSGRVWKDRHSIRAFSLWLCLLIYACVHFVARPSGRGVFSANFSPLLSPPPSLFFWVNTEDARSQRSRSLADSIEAMGGICVHPGQDMIASRVSHLVLLDTDDIFYRTVLKQQESLLQQKLSRASPVSPEKSRSRSRSRAATGSPRGERASSLGVHASGTSGPGGIEQGARRHAGYKLPLLVRWQWVRDCQSARVCIDEQPYLPDHPTPTEQESASFVSRYTNARREAVATMRRNVHRAHLRTSSAAPDTLTVRKRRKAPHGSPVLEGAQSDPVSRMPPPSRLVDNILRDTSAASAQPKASSRSKWGDGDDSKAPNPHSNEQKDNHHDQPPSLKRKAELSESVDSGVDSGPQASSVATSPMAPSFVPQTEGKSCSMKPSATRFLEGVTMRVHEDLPQAGPALHQMLTQAGATIEPSPEVPVDYSIVPLSYDPSQTRSKDKKVATFLWLEMSRWAGRRIGESSQADPLDRFYFRPTPLTLPLPKAEQATLHFTAFSRDGPERHDLALLAKELGMNVTDAFSRSNTHLVVGPEPADGGSSKAKLLKAREVEAHIVDETFIQRAYTEGLIDPWPIPRLPPKRRLSQYTLSQMPAPSALPSTYDPNSRARPTLAPIPHGRSMSGPVTGRIQGANPTQSIARSETDPVMPKLRQALLSDPNKAPGRRRVLRPLTARSRLSPVPGPAMTGHNQSKDALDPTGKACPGGEESAQNSEAAVHPFAHRPSSTTLAPTQADPEREIERDEPAPPQTQVYVSYANPRTKRERERLQVLLEGGQSQAQPMVTTPAVAGDVEQHPLTVELDVPPSRLHPSEATLPSVAARTSARRAQAGATSNPIDLGTETSPAPPKRIRRAPR